MKKEGASLTLPFRSIAYGIRAGLGYLTIFGGLHAAYANGTDQLAAHHDRQSAFERECAVQCDQRVAPSGEEFTAVLLSTF